MKKKISKSMISTKKLRKELFIKKRNAVRCAMTLAEVLIVIGVIGVVAALTVPTLVGEINERMNTEKQVNIVDKVTKAMEMMKVHGDLGKFDSTEQFVDSLQKYLKISKRCDSDHLTECWPTNTVRNMADKVFDVSTAKTGDKLGFKTRTEDKTVGLILVDGSSIILTYDTSSMGKEQMDRSKASPMTLPIGSKNKTYPGYTTDVTSAIAFVMDVNGNAGPNSEALNGKQYDIRSFRGAHFGTDADAGSGCLGSIVNKTCVYILPSYEPENCTEAYASKYCGTSSGYVLDYWAGAKKACDEINMTLTDPTNLSTILSQEWDGKPTSGQYWSSSEFNAQNALAYDNAGNRLGTSRDKTDRYSALCIGSQK